VQAGDELCDDGNLVDDDGCDSNCRPTGCGNGARTGAEACDDGNVGDGDGCDSNCQPTGCGNGATTGTELCDDGNLVNGDGCDSSCRPTGCGSSVKTGDELCDDGNLLNGDGCDSNCTPSACGNGVIGGAEACDDANLIDGDGCDSNCKVTGCGNGAISGAELCDDGNLVNGDGCDKNCTPTACGNGVLSLGEICDDGNTASGDGCDANCKPTACGNGATTGTEVCDDGNLVNGDGCDKNCTPTACGNGVVGPGEICDDGNTASGDGCDANCKPTACGNGIPTGTEVCDDGNLTSGDGCDANCKPTACGNGAVTSGEVCDDGNLDAHDGCTGACQLEIDEVEPNDVAAQASPLVLPKTFGMLTGTNRDFYAIDVTQVPFQMSAFLWRGDNFSCSSSLNLQLRAADGVTVVTQGTGLTTSGYCSTAAVTITTPGRYYFFIDNFGVSTTFHYKLQVATQAVVCGNNVRSSGEECDDGNTDPGDGCSSLCRAEVSLDESEPNDDGFVAPGQNDFAAFDADGPVASTTLVRGTISVPGDEDVFAIENTADVERTVRVQAFGRANDVGCLLPAVIALRDEFGQALSIRQGCTRFQLAVPAHGKVYLHVADVDDNEAIGLYHVMVELR
jgi:cysteine-rich repeat protein